MVIGGGIGPGFVDTLKTDPFDVDLPVVAFKTADGSNVAMLFNHSTRCIGTRTGKRSSGFYGLAAQDLAEQYSVPVAFFSGAAGSTHNLVLRCDEMVTRILPSHPTETRLTTEHVGRVISSIGEKAGIIVQQPDKANGIRAKYASAHDLRRSCAHRLINAGVSAETLKVLLRHEDFKTTERFYGAVRAAQSAANELNQKLVSASKPTGQIDGVEKVAQLSEEQIRKLQAFLNSI